MTYKINSRLNYFVTSITQGEASLRYRLSIKNTNTQALALMTKEQWEILAQKHWKPMLLNNYFNEKKVSINISSSQVSLQKGPIQVSSKVRCRVQRMGRFIRRNSSFTTKKEPLAPRKKKPITPAPASSKKRPDNKDYEPLQSYNKSIEKGSLTATFTTLYDIQFSGLWKDNAIPLFIALNKNSLSQVPSYRPDTIRPDAFYMQRKNQPKPFAVIANPTDCHAPSSYPGLLSTIFFKAIEKNHRRLVFIHISEQIKAIIKELLERSSFKGHFAEIFFVDPSQNAPIPLVNEI